MEPDNEFISVNSINIETKDETFEPDIKDMEKQLEEKGIDIYQFQSKKNQSFGNLM